jgi:transposase
LSRSPTMHTRETTFDQRRIMFEEWERLERKHGSITKACNKVHVSTWVFYHWQARYLESGLEGIREGNSHAPKHPHTRAPEIKEEVVRIKDEHPTWGLKKIAGEYEGRTGQKKPAQDTVKAALCIEERWFRYYHSNRATKENKSKKEGI